MSESYEPDPGVTPGYPYDTAFLSQRDLGLTIPINYVTVPGVSFSAACFPTLDFEDDNSGDCLSNLLAAGFRRLQIDLYWDQGRQLWSFCPVAIPSSITINPSETTTETLSFSASSVQSLTSAVIAASATSRLSARQASSEIQTPATLSASQSPNGRALSSSPTASSSVSTAAPTSLGQNTPSFPNITDSNNDPLVKIGPYLCSTTINLSTFTSQLLSFIHDTQNTLQAQLLYVIFNIHAAASDSSPTAPAPSPTSLPQPSSLIGSQFSANFSDYLYTPTNLGTDRANLNSTWYTVPELYRPAAWYYDTQFNQYGIVSSENGWPTEYYADFTKGKRLLLGWGSVDPQMSGYNFAGDAPIVFPNGYIQDVQLDRAGSGSGDLTTGCFFQPTTGNLSQVNSSWASDANVIGFDYPVTATSDILPLLNLTTNTTNCGISPILNVTLLDATAKENPVPYNDYAYATIWSWAPGEPKNSSSSVTNSLFRCASSNIDLGGRWVVNDCSQKYFTACRAANQPYNWTITTYPVSYSYASQTCPSNSSFGVPRTALENSYLTQAIRNSHRDYDGHGVWVDFNSLDLLDCWVSGGPNATCPWKDTEAQENDLRRKTVLVPSVAAVILLFIAALIVIAKLAGNRKTRKRRRKRANNGFIYEGVPS